MYHQPGVHGGNYLGQLREMEQYYIVERIRPELGQKKKLLGDVFDFLEVAAVAVSPLGDCQ